MSGLSKWLVYLKFTSQLSAAHATKLLKLISLYKLTSYAMKSPNGILAILILAYLSTAALGSRVVSNATYNYIPSTNDSFIETDVKQAIYR